MLKIGQRATVHMAGMLKDGYVFMDTWTTNSPMEVTIGDGQLLPGLERELVTFNRGERRLVELEPEDAYGLYDQDLVFEVPASSVPDAAALPVGGYIMVQADQGPVRLKVLEVTDQTIRFDSNHELAGKPVAFEMELISDGTETAIEQEQGSKGCSCGALRESLAGHDHDCECGHHH